MNDTTRFRAATAALIAATFLGVTATACGPSVSHTPTVRPVGFKSGIFRYCSYTPESDGIKVYNGEQTPCLVTNSRDRSTRKRPTPPPVAVPTGKATARTATPTPKPVKTTKSASPSPSAKVSLKKH
jgi:hypothetical protein